MNSHTMIAAISESKDPKIAISAKGKQFLAFNVIESTKYNTDTENIFEIIKYGSEEELQKLKDTLHPGNTVYISGTGLFNKKGKYNIIANEVKVYSEVDPDVREEKVVIKDSYLEELREQVKTMENESNREESDGRIEESED